MFIFTSISAQVNLIPHEVRKGEKHHLYVTPEGKVACTHVESEAVVASFQPQRSIAFNSNAFSRKPIAPQELSQSAVSATFSVTYTGFTTTARAAFQKAVDNWSTLITSTQTIRINAQFSTLGTNILGSAGSNFRIGLMVGSLVSWFPDALSDAALNMDVNPGLPDINAQFSNNFPNFYFGLDGNTPADKIDFVSVVMHEIGHGLGFSGSGRSSLTALELPCIVSDTTCYGYTTSNNVTFPQIYDRFVENSAGTSILTISNPSPAVKTFITTNNLFFDSPSVKAVNGNNAAKLYAPTTFDGGSSYSHFDESAYLGGSTNALMTPFIGGGEHYIFPGAIGCALFQDIGWDMAGDCATVLPVELSNFQAQNVSNRNMLTWTTLTEHNNKSFKIERSADGKNFSEIGEVKGAGITDFPRSYSYYDEIPLSISYYRLRQIDYDGKEKPSKIVSVSLKENKDFVIFPNPTKDKISFNASGFEPNRVVVYNNLGQIVIDKDYQINELDVSSLPMGIYELELISNNLKLNKRFVKN
jgi:Secretion system C-terminal sorting domain